MSFGRQFVRRGAPVLVLGLAIAGMVGLTRAKRGAKVSRPERRAPLVEVVAMRPGALPVAIRGQGTVVPAQTVTITPEVPGRLTAVSPQLVRGGRFRKGEVIARIDAREHRAAVRQQEAAVARAEVELAVEQGRRNVAEREWALLDRGGRPENAAGRSLALREPQLKAAAAAVAGAKAALDRARLQVERTTIKAPFDALVLQESAEIGQVVRPGAPLATLVGTGTYWVELSLPMEQVARLELAGGGRRGSSATITRRLGDRVSLRTGSVLRLLGEVDRAGKMARVLVEVPDPLSTGGDETKPGLPLLLGDFVDLEITGVPLEGVLAVPRTALREGNSVFLAGPTGELIVRTVQIAWRQAESVLVSAGIEAGDRLIVSPLANPINGMKLRVAGEPPPPTAAREAPPAPTAP